MSEIAEFTYRSAKSALRLYFEPLRWVGRLFHKTRSAVQTNTAKPFKRSRLLEKIVKDEALRALRSKRSIETEEFVEDVVNEGQDLPANVQFEHRDLWLFLINALEGREKIVVILWSYAGLRHKEIAQVLDISEANSRKTLERAKKRLRSYADVVGLDKIFERLLTVSIGGTETPEEEEGEHDRNRTHQRP